jgi:hypothetical protein
MKKRCGYLPQDADAIIRRHKVCQALESLLSRHMAVACAGLIRMKDHPITLSHLTEVKVIPRGNVSEVKNEHINVHVNRLVQYINPEQEKMEKERAGTWDPMMAGLSFRTHFDHAGGGPLPWWENPTMENTVNLAIDLVQKMHERSARFIEGLQEEGAEFKRLKDALGVVGKAMGLEHRGNFVGSLRRDLMPVPGPMRQFVRDIRGEG